MFRTRSLAHRLLITLSLITVSLAACSPASSPAAVFLPVTPSMTPFQPLPPTETETPLPTPTETPLPTPLPSPTATSLPAFTRAFYQLAADLNYDERRVTVAESIFYPNNTGETLDALLLAVETNRQGGIFSLLDLRVDGTDAAYSLDGRRLALTLPDPLSPGETARIDLAYALDLPTRAHDAVFGYDRMQINLTDWYPFVAPYVPGEGWLLHDASYVGEHQVYESSDFEVRLRVSGSDREVYVAASAPGVPDGEYTLYRLYGARTFVLSAGQQFLYESLQAGGVTFTVYYWSASPGAVAALLTTMGEAFLTYRDYFGPVEYPSLSAVELDHPDGMEYDGLFFLSDSFFDEYDGTPRNNLTTIGAHETAHQWWFGLVGNDQALQPWLDEALCTYSESIYYAENHNSMYDWWWSFRVDYFTPQGWLDTTVYDGLPFRPYTNAVYLRGARFLNEIRLRIGDSDFNAFLRDYAAQGAGRIMTAGDFFRILRAHTEADMDDIIQAYFSRSY